MLACETLPRQGLRHFSGERMADKISIDTALAVKIFLKRKYDHHLPDILAHKIDAAGTPRPKLGADKINHWNPHAVQVSSQAKIKVGKIDQHRGGGTALGGCPDQAAKTPANAGKMPEHLHQTDYGNVTRLDHQLTTRGTHLVPTQAEEAPMGMPLF